MADKAFLERRGRIAVLTMNRPESRNAVDPELSVLMNSLVSEFENDDELWVGVVTGAGPAFCAGADLKAVADGRLAEIVEARPGGFAGLVRRNRRKPLVAAVNGPALAGGCEIALACDLVVAAETATFGLPEVTRGIIAGAGGLQRLPRRIPPARALELILTGRTATALEVMAWGLVNEVVPAEDVLPRALALATTISRNAPVAVRESLAVARLASEASEREAWARTEAAWEAVLASEDAGEGPRAFAERRDPVWTGR